MFHELFHSRRKPRFTVASPRIVRKAFGLRRLSLEFFLYIDLAASSLSAVSKMQVACQYRFRCQRVLRVPVSFPLFFTLAASR